MRVPTNNTRIEAGRTTARTAPLPPNATTSSTNISTTSAIPRKDLHDFIAKHRIDLAPYHKIRAELHADPELSDLEKSTGEYIAAHLRALGSFTVHSGIGGHGVAATLYNGPGPTILLRSDTDALPVLEQTSLPYASRKKMADTSGATQPVMHACGHDVHMTCLLAAAATLLHARAHWAGTLCLVFQPAEEVLTGAKAMVADGLFYNSILPLPDLILGQHVQPAPAGTLALRAGPMMAASDSFKITFHGRGAHASQPQDSVDPIVQACSAVGRLQGVVAREVPPRSSAVLTVSAIHGGAAENVIPDDVFIRVNVRSFDPDVRKTVLGAMRRIVKAEAQASGAPRPPTIELTHSGPSLANDAALHAKIVAAFNAHFGSDNVTPDLEPIMGSEDFGVFAAAVDRPACFWYFGGTDPDQWRRLRDEGRLNEVPSNHSALFAPVMEPTISTGVDAWVAAALSFFEPKK